MLNLLKEVVKTVTALLPEPLPNVHRGCPRLTRGLLWTVRPDGMQHFVTSSTAPPRVATTPCRTESKTNAIAFSENEARGFSPNR